MNKPDSTPVATIILIIVLGVLVIGCLVGGLVVGGGLFFYQSKSMEPPPSVKFHEISEALEDDQP